MSEQIIEKANRQASFLLDPTNEQEHLRVKLNVYEGPLELLLELIKKNEMDIYDISIAEITHQYLDEIEQMKKLDLDIAGDYLVMAATLLYIKSKLLLPIEEDNEEEDGEDPRDELVRKLLEYQAFKEVAQELGFLEEERSKEFKREIKDYIVKDFEDDDEDQEIEGLSNNLYDLMQAFYKVLTSIPKTTLHEAYDESVSIEQKITELVQLLQSRKRLRFTELFVNSVSKVELVVTFLAILELVKQKFAKVTQSETFGEIDIESLYDKEKQTLRSDDGAEN